MNKKELMKLIVENQNSIELLMITEKQSELMKVIKRLEVEVDSEWVYENYVHVSLALASTWLSNLYKKGYLSRRQVNISTGYKYSYKCAI